MAVLQQIRTKFGVGIVIIIALSLLYFIIDPSTLDSAMNSVSEKNNVGNIAGKPVTHDEFTAQVNAFTTVNNFEQFAQGNGEDAQKQIREMAWQELLYKYMFNKNVKKAGINVSDDEVIEFIKGEHTVLAGNPYFSDENGNFSAERLDEFFQYTKDNPEVAAYWDYIVNTISNQRGQAKYMALLNSSATLSPLALANAVAEGNRTADIDYVSIPFGYEIDSTIVVSDSEIKAYYNAHKKFYKQNASRDIEYVVFDVTPSAADLEKATEDMQNAYEGFKTAEDVQKFIRKNGESDFEYTGYWYKAGELKSVSEELDEYAFNSSAPVSEIITEGEDFYAARVMASAMMPDEVYVKQIVVADKDTAAFILSEASKRDADFAALAAQYSLDQRTADQGILGNVGWLNQNQTLGIEGLFTAELNKPFIHEANGYSFVFVVTEKKEPVQKKQVAILHRKTVVSNATFESFYQQANDFAVAAGGNIEGYNKAVSELGLVSHPMSHVAESASQFGSVSSAREVARWMYEDKTGKGSVSDPINVNNEHFFVVALKDIHNEGYANVNEVAAGIKDQLYMEKAAEKKLAEVREKIAGKTIEEVATEYNTAVNNRSDVAFYTLGQPSVDPALAGAAFGTEAGKVAAVSGAYSIYVFCVKAFNDGSFCTEDDVRNNGSQIMMQKSNYVIGIMQDDANVKDNRARFF